MSAVTKPDPEVDLSNMSMAEEVAMMSEEEQNVVLEGIDPVELQYDWEFWARPKQIRPPGDWYVWLNLAGRGYGKTRVGAECIRGWVEESWDTPIRIAGVAETKSDARDVLVEGDSGILAICPPDKRPKYEPSKRRLTWPNGSQLFLFSGEEPDQLRGPQFHKAWVDELAKYQYPQEAWDMLEFGLRLGDNPQVVVTTTPRPISIVRELYNDPDCHVTTGTSYENIGNLAEKYIRRVIKRHEGTRLGRQELLAEILDDAPGAHWTRAMLDETRVKIIPHGIELIKLVIAIDPAVTSGEEADETGICVVATGSDGHAYVLRDISAALTPRGWARRAVAAYDKYSADRIIGEANNGGDLVEVNLRTIDVKRRVAYRKVHASRGKHIRSAPVASLFEQNRVHIVGNMPQMEDQLVAFTDEGYIGGGSPDRAEAMIWGVSYLMLRKIKRDEGAFKPFKR
jgi:phage terminase large subunit-like protein